MFKETLNRKLLFSQWSCLSTRTILSASVFSERRVKRNILCSDYGVDTMQTEENVIQGTLKCRAEIIPRASHRPETGSMY